MEYFPRLIALHISGIVHKKYPIEYLVHAVECALNGYAAIPLDVFHTLTIASHVSEPLVERELNILRLLDKGYTNQEIADELYVSPKTIENYLTRIYKKLSAGSRYEAVEKFRTLDRH
jgi:two-component system, NarL family, competent response regulator ComA